MRKKKIIFLVYGGCWGLVISDVTDAWLPPPRNEAYGLERLMAALRSTPGQADAFWRMLRLI